MNYLQNIASAITFGLAILTLLHSLVEVAYNVKNDKPTPRDNWTTPAIFAAITWFIYNL